MQGVELWFALTPSVTASSCDQVPAVFLKVLAVGLSSASPHTALYHLTFVDWFGTHFGVLVALIDSMGWNCKWLLWLMTGTITSNAGSAMPISTQ
jgi:hypothetical protein